MWVLPVSSSLVLRKERRVEVRLHRKSVTHSPHHRATHWHASSHTSHRHASHWHSHAHSTIHASAATPHVWSPTHVHTSHVVVEASLVKASTTTHALLKASHLLLWLESSSHTTHLVALEATTETAAHAVHAASESTPSTETPVIEASVLLISSTAALHAVTSGLGWDVLWKGLEWVYIWV